jgi:hypothetical protein
MTASSRPRWAKSDVFIEKDWEKGSGYTVQYTPSKPVRVEFDEE